MSSAPEAYLTRAGVVSMELARRFITLEPGDRLPTIAELAAELKTGISTVQRGLAILTESGLVTIDARGKRGTFLRELDRPGLWRAAQERLMLGLMPLPYTRRYEGLATGLRADLGRLGVPFSLAFVSGARTRLNAAIAGQQFAIVSRLAAQRAQREGLDVEIWVDFGAGSYVEGHALVWRSRRRPKRPRVGIDFQSYDQRELAELEFGDDATYVDTPYLQVVKRLEVNEFDVTVWARDALETLPNGLEVADLGEAAERADNGNTAAVIATGRSQAALGELLRRDLDVRKVLRLQRGVLEGRTVPRY
jgi:DNA-binding transcriptional ArsR family regulator